MFEHLDDPDGFDPTDTFRQRVRDTVYRRRRRQLRVAFGAVAAPVLLAVGSVAYLRSQADELERIEVGGLSPATAPAISASPTGDPPGVDTTPTPQPTSADVAPVTSALNLLVVGVDSRSVDDADFGEVNGARVDTIAVVRIDPTNNRFAVISIPRDLWITTDGVTKMRISAIPTDDPSQLVAAVTTTLGVDINHYIEIDFAGFRRIIDLAGGITIPFDAPLRDTHTGFQVDAGCQHLDGDQALAYVRARYLEQFDDTTQTWITDPTSDLGRIARQQDLITRLVTAIITSDYSTTDEIRLLTDVLDDLTVDTGITVDTLRSLLTTARQIGPDHLTTHNINKALTPTTIDGQSVLTISDPAALTEAVARFTRPTNPPDGNPAPPVGAIEPSNADC